MTPADIDRVFGRSRLKMVTGEHVEVFREETPSGERRRYTKRFLCTTEGDFRHWTEREWRILARLVGHRIGPVPDVVQFDRGATGRPALVQTYDAGVTVDHWATLLPVARDGRVLRHVFEDCAHWWALAKHCLIALDAIHELHLVHLDLKADNVCIPLSPADFDPHVAGQVLRPLFGQIALIDFAFSLISGESLATALPIGQQGDYQYQSPRLLHALEAGRRGDLVPTRQLDWRCDIYSLAAMLRRYLPQPGTGAAGAWTGRRPADAKALIDRLFDAHDREVAAQRPHRELIDIASTALRDPGLAASLEHGWRLAGKVPVPCVESPTPVTRIVSPMHVMPERGGDVVGRPVLVPGLAARVADAAGVAAAWGRRSEKVRRLLWVMAAVASGVACVPLMAQAWLALQGVGGSRAAGERIAARSLPVQTSGDHASPVAAPASAVEPASVPAPAAEPATAAAAPAPAPAPAPEPAPAPAPAPEPAPAPAPAPATAPAPAMAREAAARPAPAQGPAAVQMRSRPRMPKPVLTSKPAPAPKVAVRKPAVAPKAAPVSDIRVAAAPKVSTAPSVTPAPAAPVVAPSPPPSPAAEQAPAPVFAPAAGVPAPAVAPTPAAVQLPEEFRARADLVIADHLPRISQRAERLVLRALHAAAQMEHPLQDAELLDAARAVRLAPDSALAGVKLAATDARRLTDSAGAAFWNGRNPQHALDLQLRAFGANPLDVEAAGNLAFYYLKQRPVQPEAARRLALYALALHDPQFPTGRIEDWTTLAIASALAGRERDARNAFFVTLALSPSLDRQCRAATAAYASHGERLRAPAEAMLDRIRSWGRSQESPFCRWPPNWWVGARP